MQPRSLIIITAPWTDEDGKEHKPGAVLLVPSYIIARDEHYGIRGKHREPRPWENYAPGDTAPVEEPPNPADALGVAPRRAARPAPESAINDSTT